jgi:hypothetical protein
MPTAPTPAQQQASRENGQFGGRPPKPEKAKCKNMPMSFSVTPDERTAIAEQAAAAQLTQSEYCRRRVLGYKVVSKADQQQTALLMKITGLLKHIHNESNGAYSAKTAAMLSDVQEVIRGLNK